MPDGLRASDTDRDACIEKLEAAYADGRLNDFERQIRVDHALRAITRDQLALLTRDLERIVPTTAPSAKSPKKHTAAPIIVATAVCALLIATGVAVVAFMSTGSPSTSRGPIAVPTEEVQPSAEEALHLHSADGWNEFVRLTEAKFGSAVVVRAVIYPDYASVTVPVGDSDTRTETWYFKLGYADEAMTLGTRSAFERSDIDLATIDVDALERHLAESADVLGIADASSIFLLVGDGPDDSASYSIYVTNDYSENGYWTFTPAGDELSRYAFPFSG